MIVIVGTILLLLVAAFAKWESDQECGQLSVEEVKICTNKIPESLKVVYLSDLHDKEFGKDNCELIAAIAGIAPDMILIGGDMMNVRKGKIGLNVTERLLRDLVALAPVYYGNGNNEQRLTWERREFDAYRVRFQELLNTHDVHYLSDKCLDLEDIRLIGLDLELAHYHEFKYKKLTTGYIEQVVGKADPEKFNVLLCHSPMFLDTYAEWGADLILAGHSHGGVIRFPTDMQKVPGKVNNDRGLISGQYHLFHKYCAGEFWKENCCMIVGRGLGTHTINVRINNLTQIVVVNLLCEGKDK